MNTLYKDLTEHEKKYSKKINKSNIPKSTIFITLSIDILKVANRIANNEKKTIDKVIEEALNYYYKSE